MGEAHSTIANEENDQAPQPCSENASEAEGGLAQGHDRPSEPGDLFQSEGVCGGEYNSREGTPQEPGHNGESEIWEICASEDEERSQGREPEHHGLPVEAGNEASADSGTRDEEDGKADDDGRRLTILSLTNSSHPLI